MKTYSKRKTRALNRRELVHAAGCTHTNCIVYMAYRDPENIAELVREGVRIPRSLRHLALTPIEAKEVLPP